MLSNLNLALSWKRGEYGELLIMPANGRWDLIRPLKVNCTGVSAQLLYRLLAI